MAPVPHLTRDLRLKRPTLKGGDVEAVRRGAIRYLKDDAAWAHYQGQTEVESRTYGSGAVALVKRVQSRAGLVVDGVAGPRVDHELRGAGAYDATCDKLLRQYAAAHAAPALYYVQANGPHQSVCQDLHQTGGLPGNWAEDFCAPGGTIVIAPFDGVVIKCSGHDPSTGTWLGDHPDPSGDVFGWSVYLERADGVVLYLTHLGVRDVKVGRKMKAGGIVGQVGHWPHDEGRSHTHGGITSPKGAADAKRIIRAIAAAPKAMVAV